MRPLLAPTVILKSAADTATTKEATAATIDVKRMVKKMGGVFQR